MNRLHYITFIISLLLFSGCEEVVDVNLDTAAPRLVVEASINWVKGTEGNVQTIRLTTTTGYYNTEIPQVTDAAVSVTNSAGTVFTFDNVADTGNYTCTNFIPQLGESYTLTVIRGDEVYTAVETLFAVPDIARVEQDNEGGFLGDEVEIRFFFQDNGAENNWYMNRFDTAVLAFPEYDVLDDEFTQGNEMFSILSDEDLAPGDVVDIKLYGTSERFYNYMEILLSVSEGGGGGPFSTTPSTVRGNLVNQTNEANYALGYFRLSEVATLQYTVQ
jgi:hypothetical protein